MISITVTQSKCTRHKQFRTKLHDWRSQKSLKIKSIWEHWTDALTCCVMCLKFDKKKRSSNDREVAGNHCCVCKLGAKWGWMCCSCCQNALVRTQALNKTTRRTKPLLKAAVSLLFIIQIDDDQLLALGADPASLSLSVCAVSDLIWHTGDANLANSYLIHSET